MFEIKCWACALNFVTVTPAVSAGKIKVIFFFQAKYLAKKSSAGSVEAMKSLDDIMFQLSVSKNRND